MIKFNKKGTRLSSFPYTDLINGLTIRYVQSDHKNKEPNSDAFIFHVTDGVNESPANKFNIEILVIIILIKLFSFPMT